VSADEPRRPRKVETLPSSLALVRDHNVEAVEHTGAHNLDGAHSVWLALLLSNGGPAGEVVVSMTPQLAKTIGEKLIAEAAIADPWDGSDESKYQI
jgi:hypothetical protein